MNGKFYITTTLPYVNAEPHIGFALEIVQADVVARWQRLLQQEVVFNFGTDEHGQKIYQKALERHEEPKTYCDEYAAKFDNLKKSLNLSYTNFIRTTDEHHIEAAKEFWNRCFRNEDIYKKLYKIKYCVGCELEKTDSELVDGRCPLHPNQELETIEEENYFFRFSKYQEPLLEFYANHPEFVIPEGRLKEIKAFVSGGLEDFSVSRLKAKMPWGIDVPGDPDHVMYVWFDALINYISTLGWPENEKGFSDFWPGTQVAGKDNLRQQAAMWQAMLMSCKLPNSKQVFIHGFLTVDGKKMSKSLGNVINPIALTERYGTDVVRYFLLAHIHPWEDSDFSIKKIEEKYNADLANGLGNTVARVSKLCERVETEFSKNTWTFENKQFESLNANIKAFRFMDAMAEIWGWNSNLEATIEYDAPWTLKNEELKVKLDGYVDQVRKIATALQPFIPETAEKILIQFSGPKICGSSPLFPRIK